MDKPGIIYLAKNKVNGKVYVGQTIKTLEKRRSEHENQAYKKAIVYFQKALRHYGLDNFEWSVLDQTEDRKELNEKEKQWIRKLDSCNPRFGYNGTYGGDGVIPTIETRKKNSISKKGNKYKVGYKCRPEQIERISESTKQGWEGRKEKIKSGEIILPEKEKMSEWMKKAWVTRRKRLKEGILIQKPSKKKGVPLSPELKKKTSDGIKKWWKENKERIIKSRSKYPKRIISEETREKLSKVHKGHLTSKETRKKISEAKIGKKRTEEQKRNMSIAQKKIWEKRKAAA